MPIRQLHSPKIISTLVLAGLLVSAFFLLSFRFYPLPLSAAYDGVLDSETLQTNPKSRQINVSATMPDIIAPSAPILIAPANHARINNAQITFVWLGSTDNVAVSGYQFYLNGQLYRDNLPLVSTGTTSYTLTVDDINNTFYLKLNPPLNDGQYTFRVVALDQARNGQSSNIWDFILDTQAPIFIIQQIDDLNVSIAASNPDSIPKEPIKLKHADPWFSGTAEAGSQVTLRVKDELGSVLLFHFSVPADGRWRFNPSAIFEHDRIYQLSFKVIDQAQNQSQIKDLTVIWPSQQLTLTVPTLFSSPYTPGITRKPQLTVPLINPKELKIKLYNQLKRFMPSKLETLLTQGFYQSSLIEREHPWVNFLAPLTILSLFISLFSWVAYQTKPRRLTIKQFIWLFRPQLRKLGGIVFTLDPLEPVKLASVRLINLESGLSQQFVSDKNGFFPTFKTDAAGNYQVSVYHPHLNYPTTNEVPGLTVLDFYRKETIRLKASQVLPPLIIPTDAVYKPINQRVIVKLYQLAKLEGGHALAGLAVLAGISLIFTSWINIFTFILCLLVFGLNKKF